jgi:hypothetical protein
MICTVQIQIVNLYRTLRDNELYKRVHSGGARIRAKVGWQGSVLPNCARQGAEPFLVYDLGLLGIF